MSFLAGYSFYFFLGGGGLFFSFKHKQSVSLSSTLKIYKEIYKEMKINELSLGGIFCKSLGDFLYFSSKIDRYFFALMEKIIFFSFKQQKNVIVLPIL